MALDRHQMFGVDSRIMKTLTNIFNNWLPSATMTLSNKTLASVVNVSTAQTSNTGLDSSAAFRHGTYSTALAYGTQTTHLVLKSTHATAAATGVYVFGDINRIDTSAISTGYIHVGYDYLSVGHNLAGGYASRARLELTASCTIGEQVACLATATVAASVTLAGTGNVRAGLFELNIGASAVIAKECHCIEVRPLIASNIAGVTSGIRINVNCSSANYLDYGLDIRSMSANQTAAIRILATPESDALACGIHLEGQTAGSTSSITNAISFVGTITNPLDFEATDGSQGVTVGTHAGCGTTTTPEGMLKIDVAGTAYYAYLYIDPVTFA